MRVKQLVEVLNKCDPDAEVLGLCCDDNPLNGEGFGVNHIFEIRYADKNETVVYIDGTAD